MNDYKYDKYAMRTIATGVLPTDGAPKTLDLLGFNYADEYNSTNGFYLGFSLDKTPVDNYDIIITGKNVAGTTITETFNTADIVASGLQTYFSTNEFQTVESVVLDNYTDNSNVTAKVNVYSHFDFSPFFIDKDLIYCRNLGNEQTQSFTGDNDIKGWDIGVPANVTANGDPNVWIKAFSTGGDDDIDAKFIWTNKAGVEKTSTLSFKKDESFWYKMPGHEGVDNTLPISVEVRGKFGNAGDGYLTTYCVANIVGNIGNYDTNYKFLMVDFDIAKQIVDANPTLSQNFNMSFTYSVGNVGQKASDPALYDYMRIGYEGEGIDMPNADSYALRINTMGIDEKGANSTHTRHRDLSPKDFFKAHSNDAEEYTTFKISTFAFLGNHTPDSGKVWIRLNNANKNWIPTGDIAIFDITTGLGAIVISDDGDSYHCVGWFDTAQNVMGQMFEECTKLSGADIVFSRSFIANNPDRFLVINVNG